MTVRDRTFELEMARDAAEAGARAKASFIANMSHEIRTPMNAVIGFADVVLHDPHLTLETRQHVKTILGSARALLGIINDILD
ncbi:MAG: histidine kinase, partial [Magnetococcus sp. YQC-3]